MPIIITEYEQGTDEWLSEGLGLPSASEASMLIKKDGTRSDSRQKYMEKLAAERITGRPQSTFYSAAMRRGNEMEGESRNMFAAMYDLEVAQVGRVFKDERRRYACSPDGLILDDGGFESKDAAPNVQYKRLKSGKLPSEHFHQVQMCLLVTEREYWWFRSYCRGMRPLDIRVERDKKFIKLLEIELEVFCDQLDELVERYRAA